jgi:hypothetical protein
MNPTFFKKASGQALWGMGDYCCYLISTIPYALRAMDLIILEKRINHPNKIMKICAMELFLIYVLYIARRA